jgi:hypothetical protein
MSLSSFVPSTCIDVTRIYVGGFLRQKKVAGLLLQPQRSRPCWKAFSTRNQFESQKVPVPFSAALARDNTLMGPGRKSRPDNICDEGEITHGQADSLWAPRGKKKETRPPSFMVFPWHFLQEYGTKWWHIDFRRKRLIFQFLPADLFGWKVKSGNAACNKIH